MKRTGMVCLLFPLLAATLAAPADAADGGSKGVAPSSKRSTRRAVATYDNPTFGSASGTIGEACFPCPAFATSATDASVRMTVDDDASPAPVAFEIRQLRPDGSCCDEVAGPFCGSTGKRSVKIAPGLDVLVFVFASGDVVCAGGLATSGTARAVFSNVR